MCQFCASLEQLPSSVPITGHRPYGVVGPHLRRSLVGRYREHGVVCHSVEAVRAAVAEQPDERAVLKAEFSSSGLGVRVCEGAQDGANPPASAPAGEDFPTVAAEEPSVPGRPGQRSSWVRGVLSSRGAVLGAGIFSSRSISSRLRSGPPRAHSSQQPAAGGAQPSGSSSTPPTGQWAFQGLFDGLLGRPAILDTPHYSPAAPSPSKLRFSPEALAADEAAAAVRAATPCRRPTSAARRP